MRLHPQVPEKQTKPHDDTVIYRFVEQDCFSSKLSGEYEGIDTRLQAECFIVYQ